MSREFRSRSRSPMEGTENLEAENSSQNKRQGRGKFDNTRDAMKKVSDCRVYISNIPYQFKWQELKDFCRTEVGNVSYVEMLSDETGRPKGSAIVDFETPEMAQEAVSKLHRMEVKGRKLIVKERDDIMHSKDFMFLFNNNMSNDRNRFGNDQQDLRKVIGRTGNNAFSNDSPAPVNYGNTYGLSISFLQSLGINEPLGCRVFVSNLDYKVTTEELEEAFKVAGKIAKAVVVVDQEGKSRGFGTVEYEHPLQAVQAISMLHNQSFYDRRMNVRLDKMPERARRDGGASKLPRGLKGLGLGLGSRGEAITDVNNVASNLILNASGGGGGLAPPVPAMGMGGGFNNSVAPNLGNVGGMNPNLPMQWLEALNTLQMGMNRGVNPAVGGYGNQMNGSGGGAMGPMFNGGQSGGFGNNASSQSDFNSGYGGNTTVVQVTNLPFDYTWKNLKDLCRNYGDIRFAEIKSKGMGLVRFASDNEARRASEMLDGQRFDGRILEARVL